MKTDAKTQARIDKMPAVVRDEVARLNTEIDRLVAQLATKFPGTDVQVWAWNEERRHDLPPGSQIRFTLARREGDDLGGEAPYIDVQRDAHTPTRLEVRAGPNGGLCVRPSASNTALLEVREHYDHYEGERKKK